jgi:MFS family permease
VPRIGEEVAGMATESRSLGRPFWTFWAAAALANVGDGIRLAAFPLLAAALTDSPVAVAAVTAAQTLPWLVTGLLAGSLADRRGARTMVVAADAGRVLVLACLLVAVAGGWASIALVVLAALLLGVAALGALVGGALASGAGVDAPFLFSGAIALLATAAWWAASRSGHARPGPA